MHFLPRRSRSHAVQGAQAGGRGAFLTLGMRGVSGALVKPWLIFMHSLRGWEGEEVEGVEKGWGGKGRWAWSPLPPGT